MESNLFDVTERSVYLVAGAVQAITESLAEWTALGHANFARKQAGKSRGTVL